MAAKKKSKYDDLAPWGNLPHPYKSDTPGPKKRFKRAAPKKKVAFKKTLTLKSR